MGARKRRAADRAGRPATSPPSPPPSTADPARPSAGEPQQRPSTNSYTPVTKPVLRRPLEPGQDTTLVAEVDGVALFCADHPVPSRLVGADQALVLAAAQLLGLR
jgi:hypothetical protein